MNYRRSILGSALAFAVATSCCWLPLVVGALGGGATLLGISNGLEGYSGIFLGIGVGLFGISLYQYQNRKTASMQTEAILQSRITCPACGYQKEETMPTNACQFFYECENCHTVLKPRGEDCCVYCSYGTVACPPVQLEQDCC